VILSSLLAILAGCTADSYPLLTPAGGSEWSPAAVGSPARSVVLYLEPRAGDRIDLISAEALGNLASADVHLYFSPPIPMSGGGTLIGSRLEPLAGASFAVDPTASAGPANDVGIVAEITAKSAGTYSVTSVRLHFRINGGPEQVKEGISGYFTVCAAVPAPSKCEASPSP
jgi:hypothetical protein